MKTINSYYTSHLNNYQLYLINEERSTNTIKKYMRDIQVFLTFVGDSELNKSVVLSYKEQLISQYAPSSTNTMLAAINGFLDWLGFPSYKVKPLKIQRDIFSRPEKELSHKEYVKLIQTAEHKNKHKLSLIIQTICTTGIRISELSFITIASLHSGRCTVSCKSKNRIIFLSKDLCHQLKKYCKSQNINSGSIFITKSGKPLDRSNIWKMMKKLCVQANVAKSKVFPHNLRHLFARTYYKIEKDISRLADILGHNNINTTRIYTKETCNQHEKIMSKMQLLYYTT